LGRRPFVVITTGVDERAWLNGYGNPKSFDAFGERCKTRWDHIEALTIGDPKTSPPPGFASRRCSNEADEVNYRMEGLFSGLTDAICAPINETNFDNRIKIPEP
jgi:hypothetical protein